MKKKELLKIRELKATKAMCREVQKGGYGRCFRAAVEGSVLKIAFFVPEQLKQGLKTPLYEVYVDRQKNRYLTYEMAGKKWRTAKINMLEYPEQYSMRCQKEWQQDEERKLVNEYFETGENKSIFMAVLDFQSEVKQEDLRRKHRSEIEQIDAVMREVPPIPKDFDRWVIKNCFHETLFYEPESRYKWPKMYCTHCGNWMDTQSWPNRPEHGKETKCPKCGAKAVFRSWNKQKYMDERTDVALLQRLLDGSGYIIRNFSCKIERRHEKGWENIKFTKYETIRVRMDKSFAEREFFEYGEYKYTGINRWCHTCRRSSYWGGYYSQYGYHRSFGSTLVYTPNLKRELRSEPFAGMDLKKAFLGGERKRIDAPYRLQRLKRYPCLEYLQKAGLTNLEEEILRGNEQRELFDNSAKRIHDVLGLDRQRYQRLVKWNGNCEVLRVLQHEKETGERISDQNIRYIQEKGVKVKRVIELSRRTGMNLQRMLNYFQRQQELTGQEFLTLYRHYEDYLAMAVRRGMEITDEIVCRQSCMMEYHDRYLEEENRKKNKDSDREVNLKFPKIKENYQKNSERFAFETDKLIIKVPQTASDITREGRLQHHCVGASDRYLNAMNKRQSYILFLRRKENETTPYYTLEVLWNGQVKQFYAAYDRQPNKEEILEVLKQFTKEVRKKDKKPKTLQTAG